VAKKEKPARLSSATLQGLDVPPARVLAQPSPRVERRDRQSAPTELAERDFRRAVDFLKQGRNTEAENAFALSLRHDPSHRGARQALVALEIERGALDRARRLLQDGLALDPAQPDFAMTLARIHVERNDYPAALGALDASAAAAEGHAEYHFLRGTVLQRLGRHAPAAEAYRSALQAEAGSAKAWIGLGISLEALKQRPEAADAFRRALAAGPGNEDLRAFAEQRIRALR
jgi:MSHA biogenesis protein MshN